MLPLWPMLTRKMAGYMSWSILNPELLLSFSITRVPCADDEACVDESGEWVCEEACAPEVGPLGGPARMLSSPVLRWGVGGVPETCRRPVTSPRCCSGLAFALTPLPTPSHANPSCCAEWLHLGDVKPISAPATSCLELAGRRWTLSAAGLHKTAWPA